ncbi:MAG: ferrous iron transport protein B [Bacteriovoracaceae bacterium]|nr:ferrous iron transport protein B [Bacteriovoracaceae bacterium]
MKKILLIGSPNCGKSTLFNLLSGQARKVSNYSGVTVDVGEGEVSLLSSLEKNLDKKIVMVDLPGIYGLIPQARDEGITVQYLAEKEYHKVLVVIDASRLETGLGLLLQLKDYFKSEDLLVVVSKADLIPTAEITKYQKLGESLNLKLLLFSALRDTSKDLKSFLQENFPHSCIKPITPFKMPLKNRSFIAGEGFTFQEIKEEKAIDELQQKLNSARIFMQEQKLTPSPLRVTKTSKLDQVMLHPLWGSLIFFATFYFIFHALYTASAPLMDFLENSIAWLGNYVTSFLPAGDFQSLIADGLFAGVGGVIVFLPQVMILFFLLSLLEQSGYIARAAFLSDKTMSFFGLSGKAFLPFLSGFACSIPAIMATRTITDKKERMATLMTIPLITCSARLPVYVLLIGTFIPDQKIAGIFNAQALALFFLYFFGSIVALTMAKIFRLSFFKGRSQSFFMELPLYQRPSLKIAWNQASRSGKVFLKKAGTIIFVLSLIIWFFSSYPNKPLPTHVDSTAETTAAWRLENSMLGQLGQKLQPVFKPLGYDWKITVGLFMAFGARELFVSGMGTLYALGSVDEASDSLRDRILQEKDLQTGEKIFNLAVAWSLLIFFAFSCQCMSTLAIVKRETGTLKWPFFMFIYMGILAYLGAFLAYRLVPYF